MDPITDLVVQSVAGRDGRPAVTDEPLALRPPAIVWRHQLRNPLQQHVDGEAREFQIPQHIE
jgi:hypothetical protein